MLEAAKGLLASKKAMMAILSGIVWLVGKLGLDLDTSELSGAVAPLWAYIFAQGIADHGKGKEEFKDKAFRAGAKPVAPPKPPPEPTAKPEA